MKKLNVLLVCGSGASSGFMAANIRKAASARGLDVSVVARSESEIESYIDDIDVLMAGPHLAYIMTRSTSTPRRTPTSRSSSCAEITTPSSTARPRSTICSRSSARNSARFRD